MPLLMHGSLSCTHTVRVDLFERRRVGYSIYYLLQVSLRNKVTGSSFHELGRAAEKVTLGRRGIHERLTRN